VAVNGTARIEVRAGSLFDLDHELAEQLEPTHRPEARARAIVPVADLTAGEWPVADLAQTSARPFALMVLEGIVLREVVLVGSTASELLGPGDIVDLTGSDDALLPLQTRWTVPEAARIVVLDDRLLAILRGWPTVGRTLLTRTVQREARLATHRAIAQLPRVDLRLLAFFGHLAERWGRIAPTGVVIPLQLTHETLGRLIGARRPTVSLALKDLGTGGLLERRPDGAWLLHYEAFTQLGANDAAPGWHPADARRVEPADGRPDPRPAESASTISLDDVAALRARIAALREDHATRITRTATVIARSRLARHGLVLLQDRRAG
jgi:CRP/FNR family transcriptional regulator, cyclic AMP receptor protein